MIDKDTAALVADIDDLLTQLMGSSFNRAISEEDLFHIPDVMVPVAYAMMTFLIQTACGTGREEEWSNFLTELLSGCINVHLDVERH